MISRTSNAVLLALMLSWCGAAAAQPGEDEPVSTQESSPPDWLDKPDLDSQTAEDLRAQYREQTAARKAAEKELRQIRFRHFGQIRGRAVRDEGLAKLRTHTDPSLFPLMVELYEKEGDDVRGAMLDVFAQSDSQAGDASIAWLSIFGRDASMRELATQRLTARVDRAPGAKDHARMVIYEGLTSADTQVMGRAARLTESLQLVELIPWLVATQVTGRPQGQSSGGVGLGSRRRGDLAWIVVGTQQAYVADLQPVVAEAAVAFDPQLSTVTEGSIVRVVDAVVYTYRVEVNQALIRLSSKAWGHSTASLGWDNPRWMDWYHTQFRPFWKQQQEDKAKAAQAAAPANPAGTAQLPPPK